jgi:hypothetical protein
MTLRSLKALRTLRKGAGFFYPQSLRFIGGYLYSTLRVVIIGDVVALFLKRFLRALKTLRRLTQKGFFDYLCTQILITI